jgi:hypothetical protein
MHVSLRRGPPAFPIAIDENQNRNQPTCQCEMEERCHRRLRGDSYTVRDSVASNALADTALKIQQHGMILAGRQVAMPAGVVVFYPSNIQC